MHHHPRRSHRHARHLWLRAMGFFLVLAALVACDNGKKPANDPGQTTSTSTYTNSNVLGLPSCYQRTQSNCAGDGSCQWRNNACVDHSTQACGDLTDITSCEGNRTCGWNNTTRICEDNACYSYDTSTCASNSGCQWSASKNICLTSTLANSTCAGVTTSAACLGNAGCGWSSTTGCVAQNSTCNGLAQSNCTATSSCSWDSLNQACRSSDSTCHTATNVDQCRSLSDCTWRSNACVSLNGICAGFTVANDCNANTDCRWYTTFNSCGSALGASGVDVDPDEVLKARLALAAGLGAFQGFLTGGFSGALTNALMQFNAALNAGTATVPSTSISPFNATTVNPTTNAAAPSGTFLATPSPGGNLVGGGLANSFSIQSAEAGMSLTAALDCPSLTRETACRRLDQCQWNRNTKACENR